jgi:RNA polymerase sigma-70 factor (sigma-E family)
MATSVEAEFTAFVESRSHVLIKAAYSLTGSQHAAEDLLQNALTKTFLHWRRIEGSPDAYARKVMYHDFVSSWRRLRKLRELSFDQVPEHSLEPGAELVPLQMLLRDALLSLPARQRAVLVLRYFEDLSVEETAAAIGSPKGTVVSLASRGLAKLRELVPEFGASYEGVGA